MRKLFITLLSLLVIASCVSCNSVKEPSSNEESNTEIVITTETTKALDDEIKLPTSIDTTSDTSISDSSITDVEQSKTSCQLAS